MPPTADAASARAHGSAGPVPSADARIGSCRPRLPPEPTEVIPRSGAAHEVVGAVPAGAAAATPTTEAGQPGHRPSVADDHGRHRPSEPLAEPDPRREPVPTRADPPTTRRPS